VASAAATPQPPAPAATARPAQTTPAREAPGTAATAGLPTGSPVGKGKLSITVDFPYAWYVKIIRDKIAEQWDPYAMPGQQPRVAFEIGRNGEVNVSRIRVVQSSGSAQYDRIAVRAIAQAGKFPPLPDDFKDQVVTIDIQFRFDAERS